MNSIPGLMFVSRTYLFSQVQQVELLAVGSHELDADGVLSDIEGNYLRGPSWSSRSRACTSNASRSSSATMALTRASP